VTYRWAAGLAMMGLLVICGAYVFWVSVIDPAGSADRWNACFFVDRRNSFIQ
jgi:hypothetical protein